MKSSAYLKGHPCCGCGPVAALIVFGMIGVCTNTWACSAVCLNKNGQIILGNNMDWISGDGMVVVNKRNVAKRGFWYSNQPDWSWTSTYGSISFNTEGREFPIRGMNEAGLAIVELMLPETQHPAPGDLPVLSGSQWIQYQLDTSATVEEVLASDRVVRIEPSDWAGMASHLLICDGSGAVAGIEWLEGVMTVYTGASLPTPVMVNTAYQVCLENGNDRSGRFKPLADMYAAYDDATPRDGVSYTFAMLQAAELQSPFFRTRWSMAFDVHAKRCYWRTYSNSHLRYVELGDFDFSCQTPVMVLDVNVGGAGNVRKAFTPYTVAFNRGQVERIYALYNEHSHLLGKEYAQDTIEGIITFPDSTRCTEKPAASAFEP